MLAVDGGGRPAAGGCRCGGALERGRAERLRRRRRRPVLLVWTTASIVELWAALVGPVFGACCPRGDAGDVLRAGNGSVGVLGGIPLQSSSTTL